MLFNSTLPLKFWRNVYADEYGCWLWLGAIHGGGYGAFSHAGKQHVAHRFAYEDLIGPIPDGLTIDHLCRIRPCVNPWHLEPVTMRENILRGESPSAQHARRSLCAQGHPLDVIRKRGSYLYRECSTCKVAATQRFRDHYGQTISKTHVLVRDRVN